MKFGMGYAYWGNTWQCDLAGYRKAAEKLAGFGFDMQTICIIWMRYSLGRWMP